MKYSILRLITCLCVFTLVVPTVSASWCNTCQTYHKDSCDDGYGSGGGSGSSSSSSSNNDQSYGDAMSDMGMGAMMVYGGVGAMAGSVTLVGTGRPVLAFLAFSGGAAAFVSGAQSFWNGMTESWNTANQ